VQQGQTRQQMFDKLDANSNGSVTRAEAAGTPALIVIFAETDANGDGEISRAEWDKVQLVNPDGTSVP
jgi:Ca2+-binding EF-hand superfamily protein